VRIVFAESCTAGLVSASLAGVPGVSEHHCGSAVTYRNDTKQRWLGVDAELIRQHTAVSEAVAREMARGVLQRTPEATVSLAITGHLGPQAPEGFDGLVFVAAARREATVQDLFVERIELQSDSRLERQQEAAACVLRLAAERLLA